MKEKPKTLPSVTGPNRQMPKPQDYPNDRRAYERAMGQWWGDVEDNPKDDSELEDYLVK